MDGAEGVAEIHGALFDGEDGHPGDFGFRIPDFGFEGAARGGRALDFHAELGAAGDRGRGFGADGVSQGVGQLRDLGPHLATQQRDLGRPEERGVIFAFRISGFGFRNFNQRVESHPQGRAIAEPDFEAVGVAGLEAVSEVDGSRESRGEGRALAAAIKGGLAYDSSEFADDDWLGKEGAGEEPGGSKHGDRGQGDSHEPRRGEAGDQRCQPVAPMPPAGASHGRVRRGRDGHPAGSLGQDLGSELLGRGAAHGGNHGRLQPFPPGCRGQGDAEEAVQAALIEHVLPRFGMLFEGAFHPGALRGLERVVEIGRDLVRGDHEGSALSLRAMQSRSCWRTRQSVVRTQARVRPRREAICSEECSS